MKKLAGNPGKRPLPENEPAPARLDRLPNAPRYLNRHGQAEWRRIGPELIRLGLLTVADVAAFAAYCSAFGRWVQAETALKGADLIVYTDKGNPIQNPMLSIANRSRADMIKAAAEFGLTPSARSRVAVLAAEAEPSLAEILRGDFSVIPGGKRASG